VVVEREEGDDEYLLQLIEHEWRKKRTRVLENSVEISEAEEEEDSSDLVSVVLCRDDKVPVLSRQTLKYQSRLRQCNSDCMVAGLGLVFQGRDSHWSLTVSTIQKKNQCAE
jgi:hypothetical protein